jgi:hypothetical protein
VITGSRLFLTGECGVSFVSFPGTGTMGAALRIYVDGVLLCTRNFSQSTAVLVISTALTVPITTAAIAIGLAPGAHTIELRAVRTGTTGSATLNGEQRLSGFQI